MWGISGDLDKNYENFVNRERILVDSDDARIIYERLYADLSILDTKGAALLQFISIIVTAYTLVISPNIGRPITDWFSRSGDVALLVGAVSSYLAAFIALTVIWVRWAGTSLDPAVRAKSMFEVRFFRTIAYRTAWWLALTALILLAIYLVLANVIEPPKP